MEITQSQIILLNQELRSKTSAILKNGNNLESEADFRRACSLYEYQISNSEPSLIQAYQEYINAHNQVTSLYLFDSMNLFITHVYIYDTETETEVKRELNTPRPMNWGTITTRLPNGSIFCFGKFEATRGIASIIDKNFRVKVLPSGTPCHSTSLIYFNRSIYCFGGFYYGQTLKLSCKFDLDENRWIKLNPMPKADGLTHSALFNGNILISGSRNKNLLIYAIDINSFSTIPYKFSKNRRKILISLDRLYLIECYFGLIFESEIGDEYCWKQIGNSIISKYSIQFYFSYNKGAIYIGFIEDQTANYYKFNLDNKVMVLLDRGFAN